MKNNNHKQYCFLKGVLTGQKPKNYGNPHYILNIHDQFGSKYTANINLMSYEYPNRLKYYFTNDYDNKIINRCFQLTDELHINLKKGEEGYCLDYLRANLFDLAEYNNKIKNEYKQLKKIENLLFNTLKPAINNPNYRIGVWGMAYNNGQQRIIGVHDIHMNQGNHDLFIRENGIWQDGAIALYNIKEKRIVMMTFFFYEDQCLNTDDQGNCKSK